MVPVLDQVVLPQFWSLLLVQTSLVHLKDLSLLQVNLCQKLLFLHQLTNSMTTDCSLNYKFNTWKFKAWTWGEHAVHRNCFWHSEQFLYTTWSPHVLQKEVLTKIYLYNAIYIYRSIQKIKNNSYTGKPIFFLMKNNLFIEQNKISFFWKVSVNLQICLHFGRKYINKCATYGSEFERLRTLKKYLGYF